MKMFQILVVVALGLSGAACSSGRAHFATDYGHGGHHHVHHGHQGHVHYAQYTGGMRGTPRCTQEGSVYVAQLGRCVLTVTDPAEMRRRGVPNVDMTHDPRCRGQQASHTYKIPVVGPNGQKGVATVRCGTRPAGGTAGSARAEGDD